MRVIAVSVVVAIALLLTLPRRIAGWRLMARGFLTFSRFARTARRIVLLALFLLVRTGIVSPSAFLILILTLVSHD